MIRLARKDADVCNIIMHRGVGDQIAAIKSNRFSFSVTLFRPVSPPPSLSAVAMTPSQRQTTASPEMEPGIWSRLPEELLLRILALLPFQTLLNLRPTCKHFKSLFLSPSFLSHSKTPQFSKFLLLSYPQFQHHFPLLDAFVSRWRTLALSHSVPLTCTSPRLISASGGLLCFSLQNSFLVCNILTKTTKTIEFPKYPFSFTSASLISSPPASAPPSLHGYKIFILCTSRSSPNLGFLYDSGMDAWTQHDSVDPVLIQTSHQEPVFFNGSLHFTTENELSVSSFELEAGRWRKSVPEMPTGVIFARLASDSSSSQNGILYLVGGTGMYGISKNLKVWELKGGEAEWEEIAVLPELMWRKLGSVCYHNYNHLYCFWHEGLICICCYNWPEILTYKVGRKTWHWLPKCPFLPEKCSFGFKWFSFSPDLYALV